MSWIKARIKITLHKTGGNLSTNDAQRFVDQVRQDALFGTYAELDSEFWQSRMERALDTLSEAEIINGIQTNADGSAVCVFELRLAADLFPPEMGGAQHLIGILAGDLLRFSLEPIRPGDWTVEELTFPEDWQNTHLNLFRANIANNISSIRAGFKLTPGRPLLAFSFKPRVGFKLESLRDITLDVLNAGFNIVELDTRFLPIDQTAVDALVKLASEIPDRVTSHVGRLSLNLSLPADLALRIAEKISRETNMLSVIKIDGGLNGLATTQAIRRSPVRDGRRLGPIITSYPLMTNALRQFIPSDNYIRLLALSGVDILYPGGRPDIGKMTRSLGGSGETAEVTAVRRYRRLSEKGWPMLSIAGGIYPGQLQAFYELLGPDVAWFLGGGVALHEGGPAAGARLCVNIANEAAQLKAKAGKDWSADISPSLSKACDSMFKGRSTLPLEQLRYVSPQKHLAKVTGLAPYNK